MSTTWFVESRANEQFDGWFTGVPKGMGGWITTDPLQAKQYTEAEAKAVAAALDYFPAPFSFSHWMATEHQFMDSEDLWIKEKAEQEDGANAAAGSLHLPLESNGPQGASVQGSDSGQAEQLSSGISGWVQSCHEPQRPKAIWVVVAEGGDVAGIYPDDMVKANETCQLIHQSGSDAMTHKYVPNDRATAEKPYKCGECQGPHPTYAHDMYMKLVAKLEAKCQFCADIKLKDGGFGPSHAGSPYCESGSIASGGTIAHCTCDMCF